MSLLYIMLAFGKRKHEYNADQFAVETGYGEELLSSLYLEYEININMSMSLFEKLKTDHPHLIKRITKLEHLLANH
jgi:Zn-dependent protease with chaperone function